MSPETLILVVISIAGASLQAFINYKRRMAELDYEKAKNDLWIHLARSALGEVTTAVAIYREKNMPRERRPMPPMRGPPDDDLN